MEASGGDQRQQVAGRLGAIVAARKQPRFAAHGDAAELWLGGVVSQREAAIVEESGVSGPRWRWA
jgi:hypothetical protein